jgi:glycosyltransferase involved in cell wall biosynthesis
MIRIVHIAKPLAGVGVYIKLLSENLNPKEFKNYIFCNKNDDNIDLYDGNQEKIEEHHIDIDREINFTKDFKCFKQIVKLLRETQPDVVHCHSAKAGILGRLAASKVNIPCLYTPHAFSYLSAEQKFKRLLFKFIEKSFKFSNSKILACSNSEYERSIKDLKFPKNKVLVWVNSLPQTDNNKMKKSGISLPKKYICTIGRPSYQKNTELLIETIFQVKKEITNIHLVILGIGLFSPTLHKVKQLIKKYNLDDNITLIEWVDRSETLSILKNSNFFVSSSRYEGLSYAGLEALMLSKPGVLTNVDGNKDLIDHKVNGFLVNENSNIFASKIIELFNDSELLLKMSKLSKLKFDLEFDIERNIEGLEMIYRNLLA